MEFAAKPQANAGFYRDTALRQKSCGICCTLCRQLWKLDFKRSRRCLEFAGRLKKLARPLRGLEIEKGSTFVDRWTGLVAPVPLVACAGTYVQWSQTP